MTNSNEKSALPRLSKTLSPSRASDFKNCPRKYFYGSVLRLGSAPTEAQVAGTLTHSCLEQLFNHAREERTPEVALSYLEAAWLEMCGYDLPAGQPASQAHMAMRTVAPRGSKREKVLLAKAAERTKAYFNVEDPTKFDPTARELRITGNVGKVPVMGFLDRLDVATAKAADGSMIPVNYISDYKTGKAPAPDDRFMEDKFFAMVVYAIVLKQMRGIDTNVLRLLFLENGSKDTIRRMVLTPKMIAKVTTIMESTWESINSCYTKDEFNTNKNVLCGWCDFKQICPVWNKEMVSDKPLSEQQDSIKDAWSLLQQDPKSNSV